MSGTSKAFGWRNWKNQKLLKLDGLIADTTYPISHDVTYCLDRNCLLKLSIPQLVKNLKLFIFEGVALFA
jgi:hypothetical protein